MIHWAWLLLAFFAGMGCLLFAQLPGFTSAWNREAEARMIINSLLYADQAGRPDAEKRAELWLKEG